MVTEDKLFLVDRSKDSSIMGPISRERAYEVLDSSEKEYIYWVNKMRSNPFAFHQRYVIPFLQQFPEAVCEESKSLGRDMKDAIQLPLVLPSMKANLAAGTQASFLASTGRISHEGRGGRGFQERMKEAGITICAGEVIFQGKNDPLVALILLLIDHRVPGVGHRKSLLSPLYTRSGVAIRKGKDESVVLVQDFTCSQ